MNAPVPIANILPGVLNEIARRYYEREIMDYLRWVGQEGRCAMEERVILKIRAIQTCAELIQENYVAREIKNSVPNLAVKVILETCKELLDELEKGKLKN